MFRRPSPAMTVAICALFLSLFTAGGVARTLISGSQIKSRTITGRNVKKDALGGVEIAESKLGAVPRAATADRLGGLRAADLLRADRVLSGTASSSAEDRLIVSDPATGLAVLTGPSSRLRLKNTGTTDSLEVHGLGYFVAPNIYPISQTLAPGAVADLVFDATGFTYAQLLVTRSGAASARLDVSCSLRFASNDDQAISCLGVR